MDALAHARLHWASRLATQVCTLILPGRTVRNDWGRGEEVAAPTQIEDLGCVVVGPLSTPREITQGEQVVGLADFEVRLPWSVQEQAAVMADARITLEAEGVVQTYQVLGLDRGRPRALYLSCFCTREERRS